MIDPGKLWHKFSSDSEKLEQLKKWGLLSSKAAELKQIYYNGSYTEQITKCDVVGYSTEISENAVAVISVNNQLHKIHIDYLKDMQPTKKEVEKLNA